MILQKLKRANLVPHIDVEEEDNLEEVSRGASFVPVRSHGYPMVKKKRIILRKNISTPGLLT